jgi:hypothetical protein
VQDLVAWSIFEYDGVDASGMDGSGAVVQTMTGSENNGTALSVPLGPFGDAASNVTVGGIVLAAETPVNPGLGFAEIHEQAINQPGVLTKEGTLQTQDKTGEDTSVDWNWSNPVAAAGIALEIKAAVPTPGGPSPTGDDLLQLVRRFEPILYFHPDEKFFPSDAKRYLEHCALWRAQPPFDQKDSWGGKGQPFDRKPLVEYGRIAAFNGEVRQGDTYLGAAQE